MILQAMEKHDWLRGFLDFVFPPLCLGCGTYFEGDTAICPSCMGSIEEFDHPLCLSCNSFVPEKIICPVCNHDSALMFAYGNYRPKLNSIIISFKFRGITSPAATFAPLISEKFHKQFKQMNADAFVPVPLHRARHNHRGYNQAELLSEKLSEITGVETANEILFRIKRRRPQARLDWKKRAANVKGVFEASPSDTGIKRVILVDDVVTSGATVMEARKCMMKEGYEIAGIVAIAHGL